MRVANILGLKWEAGRGERPTNRERLTLLFAIPAFFAMLNAFYRVNLAPDYPFLHGLVVSWLPLQLTWLGYEICSDLILAGFAAMGRKPVWTSLVLGGLIGAVILQPLRGLFYGYWYSAVTPGNPAPPLPEPGDWAGFLGFHLHYMMPVAVWLAANALFLLLAPPRTPRAAFERDAIAPAAPSAPVAAPSIWPDFIKPSLGRIGTDIVAIRSEDHYVRVVSTSGTELLRHRFKDAVDELRPLGFQQIHRMASVRLSAVTAVNSDVHAASVKLRNGLTLPVSRSFRIPLLNALEGRSL